MTRAALACTVLALAGCGSQAQLVDVPSNHGRDLATALARLHAAGFKASFDAASTPCGDGLPWVNVQSPRAPARAPRGSVITLTFGFSPIPSPAVPKYHERWAIVPKLVGRDASHALGDLPRAMWPCVRVRSAHATSAGGLAVVAQSPRAGTRLPAYGVMIGRGYRPTTVSLTLAAR
jgi:beta-lactam-binding protein with PASTA domain